MRLLLATLFLIFVQANASAKPLPLDDFIRQGDYLNMSLSPSGKYIVARVRVNDRVVAVFLERGNGKLIGALKPTKGSEIHKVSWLSDEKVTFQYAEKAHHLDRPIPTGEIYVADFDGSNPKLLAGYRAGDAISDSRIKGREDDPSTFELLDVLMDDEHRILVVEHPWSIKGLYWYDLRQRLPIVSELDIRTGKKRKSETLPFKDPQLLTTQAGELRFAVWEDEQGAQRVAYRNAGESDWFNLSEPLQQQLPKRLYPIRFNNAGTKVYLMGPYGEQGYRTIYELNLKTAEIFPLFTDIDADIGNWEIDPITGEIIVGVTFRERAKYHYVEGQSPALTSHKRLAKAFAGQNISITSWTRDNSHLLIRVNSDINPGEYYYYEPATNKADFLSANLSWIDPRDMRPMEVDEVIARDGLKIPVRITLPEQAKGAPLILLIHGGPHGIRDNWEFSEEAQLLANRGFAVLQVNYRGSGGFGERFATAGYRQWGNNIINDLYDSTSWAVQHYGFNPEKICAFGGSFGAYASMMLAAKYPELLQCAVGYVGIYDLNLMFTEGDIPMRWGGINYLNRVLGRDGNLLAAFSPVNHAEKIKAKVLLIHGEKDRRAPIEHAEAMRDSLKRAGNTPDWLVYDRSGHGVVGLDDRRELYSNLLSFLAKHTNHTLEPNSQEPSNGH